MSHLPISSNLLLPRSLIFFLELALVLPFLFSLFILLFLSFWCFLNLSFISSLAFKELISTASFPT